LHESLFRTFPHQLMTAEVRVDNIDLSELGLEAECKPSLGGSFADQTGPLS